MLAVMNTDMKITAYCGIGVNIVLCFTSGTIGNTLSEKLFLRSNNTSFHRSSVADRSRTSSFTVRLLAFPANLDGRSGPWYLLEKFLLPTSHSITRFWFHHSLEFNFRLRYLLFHEIQKRYLECTKIELLELWIFVNLSAR